MEWLVPGLLPPCDRLRADVDVVALWPRVAVLAIRRCANGKSEVFEEDNMYSTSRHILGLIKFKAICIMQCMQVYYSNNFAIDGTPNARLFLSITHSTLLLS